MIVAAAIAAAALLLVLEWWRANRRHRMARVAANLLAIAALVVWQLQPGRAELAPARDVAEAALWIPGAAAIPPLREKISSAYRFALPGVRPREADAKVIPDVAYLGRHYPEINRLRIVGEGLEPFELETLRGLQVSYEPGASEPGRLAISSLHAPHEVALGEPIELRGRLEGLKPDERVRVVVESPEGSDTTTIVTAEAEPIFALSVRAPSAAGRFLWRIKLLRDDEREPIVAEEKIGIAVVAPMLPRVLVLESSPSLETTHLQRWFAQSGGVFMSRTLVGRERYRFASTDSEMAEFSQVDAGLLDRFDVLIIDARTLAALGPEEKRAIRAAVAEEGLGLLILPRGERSLPDEFSDWKIASGAADVESESRSARLLWRGLDAPLETPVALENAGLEAIAPHTALVNDSRGDAVVSAIARGRGEIALSLVRDTWQWRLQNQSATFAQYWSFLLSRLAKKQVVDRWSITNAMGAPLIVNQPVGLGYVSTAESASAGEVRVAGEDAASVLPLAQELVEPHQWQTTFWPRKAGWHHVIAPATGARLDFFVHAANEWTSVRAENRRNATKRFAALSEESTRATAGEKPRSVTAAGAWVCFAVFLLSSSYLWFERRSASGSVLASRV